MPNLRACWIALAAALLTACGARSELAVTRVDSSSGVDVVDVVDAVDVVDVVDAVDVLMARCGNGVVENTEECDLGARNALVPAFALSQPGRPETAIAPVIRRSSAVSFYNYSSASAHTGFELPGVATTFLYVDPSDNNLALFFVAGRDGDLGLPPAQPESDVEVFFRGLPIATAIAISDDSGEVTRVSVSDARGRWSFNDNSDGAVFTRLSWSESWRIVIEGTYRAGVSSVRYVDGDGRARPMVLRDAVVIEHRAGRSQCRTDCRIPRCGDGFVDGGERCDDGNTRAGDGCAADCQRFE